MDYKEAAGAGRRGEFLRVLLYVAIVAGVCVLLFFLWRIKEALILAFAAVVVAVLLVAATDPIKRHTRLPHSWALVAIGTVLVVIFVSLTWLIGAQVRSQASYLLTRLPQALQEFEQRIGFAVVGSAAQGAGGARANGSELQDLVRHFLSLGNAIASALSSLVLVIVGGFFFAADPGLYRPGLVKLFPKGQQPRVDDTLLTCGRALRRWLIGKLISMVIVGGLVGLGTWAIGLPAPLALGLLAGLTEFVPVIGPVVGAVPALLVALSEGGSAVAWTALLFVAVQQLESDVIEPLVQRRMVEIPPALLLFAVVAVGLLLGAPGVIMAAPLTVVAYVMVKKLYVRQVLGQETPVPGEDASRA
jgi:predicted PurR-regulated permease PerM